MPEIIQGMAGFREKLKRMDYAVREKTLIAAVKKGGEVLRVEMEATAPRRTGKLAREEMVSVPRADSNAYEAVARIGPSRKAFYGVFDEFGTAHMVAQPFVGPSVERKGDEALGVAQEYVGDAVERATR